MKVYDLIKKLEQYNPEDEVYLTTHFQDGSSIRTIASEVNKLPDNVIRSKGIEITNKKGI